MGELALRYIALEIEPSRAPIRRPVYQEDVDYWMSWWESAKQRYETRLSASSYNDWSKMS